MIAGKHDGLRAMRCQLNTLSPQFVSPQFVTEIPKVDITTFNLHLNAHFLRNDQFLAAYPRSWALLNSFKILPVNLPLKPWPLSVVTLKSRTLSPTVERFIVCAREVAKSFTAQSQSHES